MDKEIGIKQTRELLEGVLELGVILAEALKDGAQLEDVTLILTTLLNNEKVKLALRDVSSIGGELKDISVEEGIELSMVAITYVPKILSALKA